MSETSLPAQSALAQRPPLGGASHNYQLSDDLAKLCLPQEYKDSYRLLAWIDSICFLFLIIGLVGVKPPRIVQRPLSKIEDVVPVLFTPPEEPRKPEVAKPDQPQEPQETPEDTPQVVMPVVAAADPSAVAFAVPVQGTVVIAAAAHLAAPPPVSQAPPGPVRFNPNAAGNGGTYPPPSYPPAALRNHQEGTAIIEIKVDENGAVTSVRVYKTSGYPVLDEAAMDIVKRHWRFPPGPPRWLHWPCTFKME